MKRTKWFSADVNPIRIGWYETRSGNEPLYVTMRYWGGLLWWHLNFYRGRREISHFMIGNPDAQWRGLTKPAKGKK
jgi:hypothetical protein